MLLRETFIQLCTNYSSDQSLIHTLWNEIEKKYSSKKRHYHTLEHLQALLDQLTGIKSTIKNHST